MSKVMSVKDPVCGMEIEVNHLSPKTTYNNNEFYFCCPSCFKTFEEEPSKYVINDIYGNEQHEHHCCHGHGNHQCHHGHHHKQKCQHRHR